MKILFVIRRINNSGASKILLWLISKLQYKYTLGVVSYTSFSNDVKLHNSVKLFNLVAENKVDEYLNGFIGLRKCIVNFSPDLIISFCGNASVFSILSSFSLKIPVLICERSDPYLESTFFLRIMRYLFRFARGGIFQTAGARDYYKGIVSNNIVIPNPVVLNREIFIKPFLQRKNRIVCPARLIVKQKRQDVLLEAFSIFLKYYPTTTLSLCGDGPDLEILKKLAYKLDIFDNVIFEGNMPSMLDFMSDSKFVVLSSDYEGISNSLIESMSIGIPVISTDTSPGGARVLINNTFNGFIVPRGDCKQLAEKMIFYMNNPIIADEMGDAGKEINSKYSEEKIFRMWDEFILMNC